MFDLINEVPTTAAAAAVNRDGTLVDHSSNFEWKHFYRGRSADHCAGSQAPCYSWETRGLSSFDLDSRPLPFRVNCLITTHSEVLFYNNNWWPFRELILLDGSPSNLCKLRSKIKYDIYIYSEPRTFPNVQLLLNNAATTIELYDSRCVIFLQLSKCT